LTFDDDDGVSLSLELSDDGDGDDTLHLLAQPANLPFPDFFNLIIRVS
jgi:hypothetical protein